MEAWPSGRWQRLAKPSMGKLIRRFESYRLRKSLPYREFTMNEGLVARAQRWGGWPLVGGAAALLLALWFATSAALVLWWRSTQTLNVSRIPLDVWSYVQAVLFAAVGVAALRRRPRAQPWVFGSGVLTVLLSAQALSINRWSVVPIGLGVLMAVAGACWKV